MLQAVFRVPGFRRACQSPPCPYRKDPGPTRCKASAYSTKLNRIAKYSPPQKAVVFVQALKVGLVIPHCTIPTRARWGIFVSFSGPNFQASGFHRLSSELLALGGVGINRQPKLGTLNPWPQILEIFDDPLEDAMDGALAKLGFATIPLPKPNCRAAPSRVGLLYV